MKLNLGSRDTHIEGFTGIDCEEHAGVDMVCDISKLPHEDGSVEEIYASHCLEHFPHIMTLEVLKEWNRVLVKGGILWLAVPDFEAIARIYSHTRQLNEWFRNILYGDQIYDKAYHLTAFDLYSMCEYLQKAGFTTAEKIGVMPYGLNDCSNLTTTRGDRVSLNLKVTK